MKKIRWGILATGYIAGQFAKGLTSSLTGELVAVSSRNLTSAETFRREFGARHAHGSHAELLARDDIDAVYIATPHPFHASLAIEALQAGKHVLCEKPIAMNARDAQQVIAVAQETGLLVMEAFMYRCHPQTARAVELIREGALGNIKLVQAAFGFNTPFDPAGRLFAKELGGGGILDVGGYPVSFACLVADAASDEPDVGGECIGAVGDLHPETGTDTFAIANLRFGNGVAAQVSVSTQLSQNNVVRICGDKGWLELPEPWVVSRSGGEWAMHLHADNADSRRISGSDKRGLYGIEADHFAALLAGEAVSAPGMPTADTLRVNGLLDQWRQQIGLSYASDR